MDAAETYRSPRSRFITYWNRIISIKNGVFQGYEMGSNTITTCLIASLLLIQCSITLASESPKSFLTVDAIREGWESNYGNMRSMHVSYTERIVRATPPTSEPEKLKGLTMIQHVERIEHGKCYHTRYSTSEDGFLDSENLMEHGFDGELTQEYWGMENLGTIALGLNGRNTETMNSLRDYMLMQEQNIAGMELQKDFPNKIPLFSLLLRLGASNSSILVRPHLESVAGIPCHVVEPIHKGEDNISDFKYWIAHDRGMLPLKYQRYHYNRLVDEIVVEQVAKAETDTGTIWYPQKAHRTTDWTDIGRIEYEFTTHTFIPNVETDRNSFRFDFPVGTRVIDKVVGIEYIVGVVGIDEVTPVHAIELTGKKQMTDGTERQPSQDTLISGEPPEGGDIGLVSKTKHNKQIGRNKEEGPRNATVLAKRNHTSFGSMAFVISMIVIVIVCGLFGLLLYRKYSKR